MGSGGRPLSPTLKVWGLADSLNGIADLNSLYEFRSTQACQVRPFTQQAVEAVLDAIHRHGELRTLYLNHFPGAHYWPPPSTLPVLRRLEHILASPKSGDYPDLDPDMDTLAHFKTETYLVDILKNLPALECLKIAPHAILPTRLTFGLLRSALNHCPLLEVVELLYMRATSRYFQYSEWRSLPHAHFRSLTIRQHSPSWGIRTLSLVIFVDSRHVE